MIPKTPKWIVPSEPGLITNVAGTQAAPAPSFSAPLTVQYKSPGGSNDGPVAARYRMVQTKLKGATVNPTLAYDSGWGRPGVGPTGTTTPMPAAVRTTPRSALWAEEVGRVYVFDQNVNTVWSAPVSGLSVGSWRMETPPPTRIQMMSDPVKINGQIYVQTTAGFLQVPLNGDGSLGSWTWAGSSTVGTNSAAGIPIPGAVQNWCQVGGLDCGPGQGGLIVVINPNGACYSYVVTAAANTITSYQAGPTLPVSMGSGQGGGAILIDTSWYPGTNFSWSTAFVHVIAGNGTNTYWTTLNLPGTSGTLGALGSSWNAGTALPAGLYHFACASTPQMLSGGRLNGPDYGKDQDVYVIGGQSSQGAAVRNQVLAISGVGFRSPGTWTDITPASGFTPTTYGCACAWPMPGANPALPAMVVGIFGGYTDANAAVPNFTVQTFFGGQMANTPASGSVYSTISDLTAGQGQVMPEATPDPDDPSAYLYTFTPHLPNQSKWGGPFDGDQYTIECDFASVLTGDPSPPGLTTLNFAKGPTITNVSPTGTITNGNPTVTFEYQPGAFGGDLAYWRVLITLGDTTIADSGNRTGSTTWQPGPAPCLTPGVTYGLQITATSTDATLVSADTNTQTYQGTFTPEYILPDPPYDLTAAQDTDRGAITASWLNPASAAFNRLYYRITGDDDPSWWLLQDSIPAQQSMTLTVIDQLALGQTYDIAVTALDSSQSMESGIQVTVVNGDVESPGPSGALPTAIPVYSTSFEATNYAADPPVGTYNTVLWRSLGTDSQNSLDGWQQVRNGATMYANSMRMGQWGFVSAGHPDWQDGTFTVRLTIPQGGAQAWVWMGVHVSDGMNSWVSFEWVPAAQASGATNPFLRIWTYNTQENTNLGTGGIVSVGPQIAQAAGSSYWMTFTATGHNYVGRLYSDNAGAIGTLLGTISTNIPWTSVGAGKVALACDQGEVIWGGPYANVCTWSGTAPNGWAPATPAGTPQSTSTVLNETFTNLTTNWNQMTTTAATVASNVVSLPLDSGILSKQTYTDGVWTLRVQSSATANYTPWLYVRASGSNVWGGGTSTTVPNPANAITFQFNPYNTNPNPIALWKQVNGNLSLVAESMQKVTIAASTWYWFRVIMQGANVSIQLFSDSAGAMGTMLASCTGHIPDAVLRQGSIGIGEGYGAGAVGGAYSNVCTFATFNAASGSGEPAYALSEWEAQATQESISVLQQAGQKISTYSGWQSTSAATLVPVVQGDSYTFSIQANSSDGANCALLVDEYNASGALTTTTVLGGQPSGTDWHWPVVVTAAGSSANYTNSTRGSLLHMQPDFNSPVVGSLQEGQPAMTAAGPVPDRYKSGQWWYPVVYNGAIAYLWTADAGPWGSGNKNRGGFTVAPWTITGSLVPQATTTYLSVRPAVNGPGLHYFDQLTISQLPDVLPALFKSFGTDATGTLATWTPVSPGATISANVVTLPSGAAMYAGHPDWTDSTVRVRFQAVAGSNLVLGLRYDADTNSPGVSITAAVDSTGIITFTAYDQTGAQVLTQNMVGTVGNWYWLYATVQGSYAQGYIVADSGGAPGTTVLLSGSGTMLAGTAGSLYLASEGTSSAVVGGAYPETLAVFPVFMPADWAMVNQNGWTSSEPAFCWDQTTAESGSYSLSIENNAPNLLLHPDFDAIAGNYYGFISLGSNATGTLTAWATVAGSGATIASNVATLPAACTLAAGHPEWTNGTFYCRVSPGTGGAVGVMCHYNTSGGTNWIRATAVAGGGIRLDKMVNGTETDSVATNATPTVTAGTYYWIALAASGTSYTMTLYADSSGAMGSSLGTVTATISDASVQQGQMGLSALTATGSFGGAYSNVCYAWVGYFTNWTPVATWTSAEPAFAASLNSYSGNYSVSIYIPPGAPTGWQGYVYQQPTVTAGHTYLQTGYFKGTGVTALGGYLGMWDNGTNPSAINYVGGPAAWQQFSNSLAATSTTTYIHTRFALSGPGQVWIDLVSLTDLTVGNPSYWVTQLPGEVTSVPVSPSIPYTLLGWINGSQAGVGPAYQSTILATPGLGSFYRLDDAASPIADIGPNGSNGTASGSVAFGQSSLLYSTYQVNDPDFSTELQGGTVNYPQPAYGNSWSIECWFQTTATGNDQHLLWSPTGAFLYINPSNHLTFTPGTNTLGGTTAVTDGKPHHAVMTWDGTTLSCYQDGVLVQSTTAPNPASGLNMPAQTWQSSGFTSAAPCYVDEVAFYSVPITAATVAAHYQAGSQSYYNTVRTDAPTSFYRLDDSGEGLINDYSSAANHYGTASGSMILRQPGLITTDTNDAIELTGGTLSLPQPAISGAWSMELWFQAPITDTPASSGRIFLKGTNVWFYLGTGGVLTLFDGGSGHYETDPTGYNCLDGQVHHVVATWDGSNTAILYRDGIQVISKTGFMTPANMSLATAQTLTVGGGWSTSNPVTVDEIAIYPTALSATRIAAHYAAGLTNAPWQGSHASGHFVVEEWSASGVNLASHSSTGPAGPDWQPVTASFITNAAAAYVSVRALATAIGIVNFDNVSVAPGAGVDNVALATTIVGPNARAVFHLAGNNGQNVVAAYMGTYMRSSVGGPQVTFNFDTTQIGLFGVAQPIIRSGVLKWRSINLSTIFLNPEANAEWTALRELSIATGVPVFYRDTSGRQVLCFQANANHQTAHEPSNYQAATYLTNVLWETQNTVSPYTDALYVVGRRALVNGSLPALSHTEDI